MLPPKKLSEEQIQELRRCYIAGQSMASLATHYGVSVPTVRRYCKDAKEDFAESLKLLANYSLQSARQGEFRSAGEAVNTGISALKALRELYPLTMREAARWVVKLPGFEPVKFAEALREEWDIQ